MTSKIEQIARHLADRVKKSKRPYSDLEWIVENCDWQYKAEKSELVQAHLAAINILKAAGIENAKRGSLTKLTPKQRKDMRTRAKKFAALLSDSLGLKVEVPKKPIQAYGGSKKDPAISVAISIKPWAQSNLCLRHSFLKDWAALEPHNQIIQVRKLADSFKSVDIRIGENIEVIKADLESLLH